MLNMLPVSCTTIQDVQYTFFLSRLEMTDNIVHGYIVVNECCCSPDILRKVGKVEALGGHGHVINDLRANNHTGLKDTIIFSYSLVTPISQLINPNQLSYFCTSSQTYQQIQWNTLVTTGYQRKCRGTRHASQKVLISKFNWITHYYVKYKILICWNPV